MQPLIMKCHAEMYQDQALMAPVLREVAWQPAQLAPEVRRRERKVLVAGGPGGIGADARQKSPAAPWR